MEKDLAMKKACSAFASGRRKDIRWSEVIALSDQYTRAEAYAENADGQLERKGLQLNFGQATQPTANFELYQNQPNPFNNETQISFELPVSGKATLSVYDVSGKLLKVIEDDYAAGYHSVDVNVADLAGSGVYYYTLQTANESKTLKMISLR